MHFKIPALSGIFALIVREYSLELFRKTLRRSLLDKFLLFAGVSFVIAGVDRLYPQGGQMLKSINPLLTGDLLAILSDMGHGDEIAIVDANFPADSMAQRLVQLPGISATDTLEAVLSVLPLDDFVESPAAAMDSPNERPEIYPEFEALLHKAEGRTISLEPLERFAFYERTKEAYAVIATGERRLYANIILKKGVLRS